MNETNNTHKRTLKDDPQYFGGYLNMARHNMFLINNDIAKRFGITPLDNEEHIANSFLAKKLNNKGNHIFSHLIRFMPIVKIFDPEKLPKDEVKNWHKNEPKEKNFDKMAKELKFCFDELNQFRNDYSHFYSVENGENRKINITDNLKSFIIQNYKRAIEYTKKRFENVFTNERFNLAYSLTESLTDGNKITEKGLVFFTCLFLDRENAFHFINKIIGFKGTHTQDFKATREVFSAFCVRLPHNRFVSENPKQAFALDMLNELDRCPQILFDALTDKDKIEFLPTVSSEEEDYETYFASMAKKRRNKSRFEYFALKYLDNTQFTDKIQFHINLGKYQIDKYEKDFNNQKEDRPIIENAKAFGRLDNFLFSENTDSINIEEIREKAKIYCETNIKNKINSETSEFEQFAPRYNNNKKNKIGFFKYRGDKYSVNYPKLKKRNKPENKSKFNLKQTQPTAFISIHELKKIVLLDILEKGKAEQIINEFLELNKKIFDINFIDEIKDKLNFDSKFYKKFRGKNEFAYEEKELKDLHTRKKRLNEVLSDYNLNVKQIPSRIVDRWLDILDVRKKQAISNTIKAMKTDCTKRIKDFKKGKAPKIGEMATYLARDIVDMVIDKDVKKKITSFYYNKMQESLALYSDNEKQRTFKQICNELNLFNKEIGHPFLVDLQISKIKSTSEFYENYLTEKGTKTKKIWKYNRRKQKNEQKEIECSWLFTNFYILKWNEKAKKNLTDVALPKDLTKLSFSIRNLEKEKTNFEKWLENRKKQSVNLPTDIFDNVLKKLLQNKLDDKQIAYNQTDKYHYLLKLWLGENNLQPFYNYEREYSLYDEKINFKLGTKPRIKDYFEDKIEQIRKAENQRRREIQKKELQKKQVLDVFNNAITENEKAIRFTHETDRILLLMLQNTIEYNNDLNINLTNIKTALNEPIEISEKISAKLSYNPNKGKIIEKTITDNRKRKDFSILKKYIHDRRLPELFEYFEEDTISHSKLKKELDSYNRVKELIFDSAFEIEKAIIAKAKDKIIEEENKRNNESNIQHEPYLTYLKDKKIITEEELTFLNIIRGTFSHNQFPPKATIVKHVKINKEKPIAEQIYEIYDEKKRALLTEIEKI